MVYSIWMTNNQRMLVVQIRRISNRLYREYRHLLGWIFLNTKKRVDCCVYGSFKQYQTNPAFTQVLKTINSSHWDCLLGSSEITSHQMGNYNNTFAHIKNIDASVFSEAMLPNQLSLWNVHTLYAYFIFPYCSCFHWPIYIHKYENHRHSTTRIPYWSIKRKQCDEQTLKCIYYSNSHRLMHFVEQSSNKGS